MTAIIGIDPGVHGGIAWINPACHIPSERFGAVLMPKRRNKRGRWEIAGEPLCDLLMALVGGLGQVSVYLEDVHAMPKMDISSMFNFGYGAGRVQGILDGLALETHLVSPMRWKRAVLGDTFTHDKQGAIFFCQTIMPSVSLIPSGHSVPSDGLADALCIAFYGYGKEDHHE